MGVTGLYLVVFTYPSSWPVAIGGAAELSRLSRTCGRAHCAVPMSMPTILVRPQRLADLTVRRLNLPAAASKPALDPLSYARSLDDEGAAP